MKRGTAALHDFLARGLAEEDFDLEAQAFAGGDLYPGFKSPLDANGDPVILKLENAAAMFEGETPRYRSGGR